ncbi:MAG: hypothetical protein JO042_16920, partial [Sinobacteraceae bacterium]|nr:hypothetical protein [Nevskiaceae bacterium]
SRRIERPLAAPRSILARLGVGRDLSSLAVPFVLIGSTLLAPVVGIAAARISLRLLMMIGAGASIAGYAALAAGHSLTAYLVAYGLLVGPGMCLCGMVLPSVLVTRWFTGLLMGELAREPQFWVLVSAMAAILSGQIMFGAHLVPIARQWGANEAAAP